ncbi:MAG: SIS domain-containing protein [Candidatus Diapherotrites archaeon]|nr:SIS domain-containing protein [Candidatus Diapherotrites archaeon]
MRKKDFAKNAFDEHLLVLKKIAEPKSLQNIRFCAKKIADCFKRGNKVLIFGNGGSAADSEHFAAELIGKLTKKRKPLPAIALPSCAPIITAISNDFGFEDVFSRQLEALAKKDDVVIAISTSGLSKNVIKGVLKAKEKGAYTIAITSVNGRLKSIADNSICIDSKNTQRIQEMHIFVIHLLCEFTQELCKKTA